MLPDMRRMLCLDGLRGVLACYVMLSHALPFATVPAWMQWTFSHGGAAVDVFFILSGLVIAQSLASYRYCARPFLIARVARIYPVFLVTFAFAVVVQPLATGFEHMPWIGPDSSARFIWSGGWPNDWGVFLATHLTMTHGMFPNGVLPNVWLGFLGSAWSLSTEWQFYVLALALGERKHVAWLFVAMAVAAIAWNVAMPEPWRFSRAFLPNKAQYFALGLASAAVTRRGQWRTFGLVLSAALTLCFVQGGAQELLPPLAWTVCLMGQLAVRPLPLREGGWWEMGVARSPYPPPARGGGILVLHWLGSLLESKPLIWLGSVSYCIYLTNEPVQKLLGISLAALVHGNSAEFTALWLPGAVALPLLLSWWLHEWLELPAQRYGRGIALAINVQ